MDRNSKGNESEAVKASQSDLVKCASSMNDYNNDQSRADALEWHAIVNIARVRKALRRLAMEAKRQDLSGEAEEGGFAAE